MRNSMWRMAAAIILGAAAVGAIRAGAADEPAKPQADKNPPAAAKPEADKPKPEPKSPPKTEKPQGQVKPVAAKEPAAKIDWPAGRVVVEQSDVEARIRETLDNGTSELQFVDTSLADVVEKLRSVHEIPIRIDMPALVADGLSPDSAITANIREGTLRAALRTILKPRFAFAVADDHLVITTPAGADMLVHTRIYQVHDLVVAANDPTAEAPQFQALIDLITATILPETWRDVGGIQGSMTAYQAPGILALVVTQTEDGHDQVGRLLASLRAAAEPKVADVQRRTQTKPTPDSERQTPFVTSSPVVGEAPARAATQGGGAF